MKGFIFMIVVTLVVLASFARPEKEINPSEVKTVNKAANTINKTNQSDSITIVYRKG